MFSSINWKDLLERVGWTFAQAFLGVFATASLADLNAAKTAAVAGVAAGVAAVLSVIKNVVKQNAEGE